MNEDRLPPSDTRAEEAVIGCLFAREGPIAKVAAVLEPKDFYLTSCQLIFEAAMALNAKHVQVDLVTLPAMLTEMGCLEDAGGTSYLIHCAEFEGWHWQVEHYARIVSDMSQRRRLIASASELSRGAYDLTIDAGDTMTLAEAAIREARAKGLGSGSEGLGELATRAKGLVSGSYDQWPTGVDALDAYTGGLAAGTTWVVGGRSRHGKTALSVGMIEAAMLAGKKVLNLRYEEIPEAIMLRLASRRTGLAYSDAQMRRLSTEDSAAFKASIDGIASSWSEGLDIRRGERMEAVEARCEAWRPNLVIIDTIQKMALAHSDGKTERHDLRLAGLTARLADMAMRLKCCVVMLSQISGKARGAMPTMADLRESGALGEDADTCVLLWWPKIDKRDSDTADFLTGYLADVAKNRIGGRVGRLHLTIDEGTQKLETMSDAQRSVFQRWEK